MASKVDMLTPEEATKFQDILEEFFPELTNADSINGTEAVTTLIEMYQAIHDREAQNGK